MTPGRSCPDAMGEFRVVAEHIGPRDLVQECNTQNCVQGIYSGLLIFVCHVFIIARAHLYLRMIN
jgi:hypothetical protein